MPTPSTFLETWEVERLTGRRQRKTQIEQLRAQLIPFYVNAAGWPVVARSAIEGRASNEEKPRQWAPRVLQRAA